MNSTRLPSANEFTPDEELQSVPDAWIDSYIHERTHQGMCCGRTPMVQFENGNRNLT